VDLFEGNISAFCQNVRGYILYKNIANKTLHSEFQTQYFPSRKYDHKLAGRGVQPIGSYQISYTLVPLTIFVCNLTTKGV
jgi:hypothetical protein